VATMVTYKNRFKGSSEVLVVVNDRADPIGALGPPLTAAGLSLTFCDVRSGDIPASPEHFAAVVAMGGDTNPDDDSKYGWLSAERSLLRACVEHAVPTIAVYLGAQLLAQALGARARRMPCARIGWMTQHSTPNVMSDPLGGAWAVLDQALEWHTYSFDLPPDATLLAGRDEAVQAFRAGRCVWGFQYHLEADDHLAAHWLNVYRDDLDESVDANAVMADGRRSAADQAEHGRAVGRAFADLAVQQAMKGNQ
jgi:GMP synthase (glutamine-hydrolysing)